VTETTKDRLYRDLIDALVKMCLEGQGQIHAGRIREDAWKLSAFAVKVRSILSRKKRTSQPKAANPLGEPALNDDDVIALLGRLSSSERAAVARLVTDGVVTGVFETLKALERFGVSPFEEGYEGSPYNDFIGRLSGEWSWPE